MSLSQMSLIQILLLLNNVLVDEILTTTKLNLLLGFWLICISLFVGNHLLPKQIVWILHISINYSSSLSSLKLSVLILYMLWCHHLRLTVSVGWRELLLGLWSWLHSGTICSPIIHYSSSLLTTAVLISICSVLTVSILIHFHRDYISSNFRSWKLLLTISSQLRLGTCRVLCL